MQPVQQKPKSLLSSLIAVIVVIFVVKSCFFSSNDKKSEIDAAKEKQEDLNRYAYIISESYVKRYLKAPSSAEFDSWTASPGVTNINNDYIVVYHFDAQNAFGAMLRSNYRCYLKYLSGDPADNNNWLLEQLYIDGKQMR